MTNDINEFHSYLFTVIQVVRMVCVCPCLCIYCNIEPITLVLSSYRCILCFNVEIRHINNTIVIIIILTISSSYEPSGISCHATRHISLRASVRERERESGCVECVSIEC